MKSPTYTEILLQLRKALPTLQARFGVQRIGIHGTAIIHREDIVVSFSKSLKVVIDSSTPLGPEYFELCQQLQQLLKRPVQLLSFKLLIHGKDSHIRFV